MNDDERIARLSAALIGTGATVNGPFNIWALDSTLDDAQLAELAEWADLEHIVLSGCPITDAAFETLCCFQRLETLDFSGTRMISRGITAAILPRSIQALGVAESNYQTMPQI